MKSGTRIAALAVLLALGAALPPLPASAAGKSAAAYRGAAFYRALLSHRPPRYWAGGTMFVPLGPLLQSAPIEVVWYRPRRAPVRPITLRVPEAYLAAALAERHPSPMWVKTAHGFRLEP